MRVCQFDLADPAFPISLVEVVEPPLPTPSWARVRVEHGGICGSDLHSVFPNEEATRLLRPFVEPPMQMGHEICGVVLEAGPECDVAVGARVAVDPTIGCKARGIEPMCPACRIGAASSCHNLASHVGTGGFAIGFTTGLGCGWADQVLAHNSMLHVVPEKIDMRTAALTEPLSVAIHGLLRRQPPDGVPALIIGGGIVGLACIPALRAIAPSTPITIVARHRHQVDAAERLGADHVVVPDEAHEYVGELARLGGGTVAGRGRNTVLMGGYGVVVDAVGSSEVFAQATRFCAQRGTVYAMGALGTVHADLAALYFKELEVVGTLCHAVDQLNGEGEHSFDRALALLAHGKYPADIIVTHDYALADYREALETAQNRKAGAIKVLLHP